ncbi:hypothetical protein [Streptomyces litchfieldiae]|uniref:Uncharacterized protein n=1 Tax=Streptomyces litchfieldiae TaxID=3075543 RepID=A0ABU2MPD5_9ACTN|nr:hypothetical protein [Streptomyces sp. DSM 44938]MDT0343491.1 hypothetical protein [Streptomyces sp. DSM 44938]
MLEDLPLEQALLMTVAATALACTAAGAWIPNRTFRTRFPVVLAAGAAGVTVAGEMNGHPVTSMLVVWSFLLVGLTVGMFPLRTWLTRLAHENRKGVRRDTHDWDIPRWRVAFCVIFASLMALAGAALTSPA